MSYSDINRRCFSSKLGGMLLSSMGAGRALGAAAHASPALSLPATQWCISHGASESCRSLA